MAKFITLTRLLPKGESQPVYVNESSISRFFKKDYGNSPSTYLICDGGQTEIPVAETPEEIMSKILTVPRGMVGH